MTFRALRPPHHPTSNRSQAARPRRRRWAFSNSGARRRAPPRDLVHPDAKHDRHTLLVMNEGDGSWLPPHGVSLKEAFGRPARVFILRCVGKLLIVSADDDAHPVAVRCELVDLDTDERILSHPLDFLPERRVAVEKLPLQIDADGNDVRLIVEGTGQPGNILSGRAPPGTPRPSSHGYAWRPLGLLPLQ